MTNERITKEAEEYILKEWCQGNQSMEYPEIAETAYIAGALAERKAVIAKIIHALSMHYTKYGILQQKDMKLILDKLEQES